MATGGVWFPLGPLEGQEDPAPNLVGVFKALETRGQDFPVVAAEIRVPGTGGKDQIVVA